MTQIKALVIVTNGTEELEAGNFLFYKNLKILNIVTVIDVLRRAKIQVTVAGLEDKSQITCANGTFLVPDESLGLINDPEVN